MILFLIFLEENMIFVCEKKRKERERRSMEVYAVRNCCFNPRCQTAWRASGETGWIDPGSWPMSGMRSKALRRRRKNRLRRLRGSLLSSPNYALDASVRYCEKPQVLLVTFLVFPFTFTCMSRMAALSVLIAVQQARCVCTPAGTLVWICVNRVKFDRSNKSEEIIA